MVLIGVCVVTLIGIRVFSPEDTRIWDKGIAPSLLASHTTSMKIITDFIDNGMIPSVYTCDGDSHFPSLTIEDFPTDTKSFVLIVDDPDAPTGIWNHLLLANIPVPEDTHLTISQETFSLALLGQNSRWDQARWAPCPPSGTHRYIFRLYALSDMLDLSAWFSKERLLELMWDKIIDKTQLVGLYKRQ